jgi:hypothetical protein
LFSVSILIRTFLVGVSIKTLVETRLRKTGIMLVYRSKKSRDDTGFQELDTVNHIVRDAEKFQAHYGHLPIISIRVLRVSLTGGTWVTE